MNKLKQILQKHYVHDKYRNTRWNFTAEQITQAQVLQWEYVNNAQSEMSELETNNCLDSP